MSSIQGKYSEKVACDPEPTPIPVSPIDHALDSLARARYLAQRVQGLVNRLTGYSEGCGSCESKDAPTAVFQQLRDSAERTDDELARTHTFLAKLEDLL